MGALTGPDGENAPAGSLAVEGAIADGERIADLLRHKPASIANVVRTFDNHHPRHIGKNTNWVHRELSPNDPGYMRGHR